MSSSAPWYHVKTQLRRRILTGIWQPGRRLPPCHRIIDQFRCSPATLQKAIDGLRTDGFLECQPRKGIFVAERPPHTHRFAQVFRARPQEPNQPPCDPRRPAWSRFCQALFDAAAAHAATAGVVFHHYYEIADDRGNPAFRRLYDDLSEQRLAGVLVHADASFLPMFHADFRQFPLVGLAGHDTKVPGVPLVVLDDRAVFAAGFRKARDLGCRRVACLSLLRHGMDWRALMLAIAHDAGLELPERLHLQLDEESPADHQAATQALLATAAQADCDGLVICNDNLVPGASRGVLRWSSDSARTMPLIAHANFPCPTDCAVPAWRFGPDCRQVLRLFLDLLADRGRGLVRDAMVEPVCCQETRPPSPA